MCIVFMSYSPSSKYRFILAANRDEYYNRPSRPASFWYYRDVTVLSGLDMKPGKECGSWLGITTNGKISVITNYMQPNDSINAKGRGHIVTDYLISDLDSYEYLDYISRDCEVYNGFNLITATFNGISDGICYYSNMFVKKPIHLVPGIYGICNCLLDTPWNKLQYGKMLFTNIIDNCNEINTADLVDKLLTLLNDGSLLSPDQEIENQGKEFIRPIIKEFSAICVKTPNYGTRTNTIIIIDEHYNVTFVERDMSNPDTGEWTKQVFEFSIKN
ncbi:T10-like protein [Turkeypox virus]|uniref:T10-like protein n=1 Tax=Turkeypox virus TaxID=336486 RepID=A0A0M3ZEJ9_9POXV|nr:T10-like protein [Turkeypox virus]ALA62418.1 T10-like protein [Turkeypox virus]